MGIGSGFAGPCEPELIEGARSNRRSPTVERADNLDRWSDPAARLVTLILMRCGLRVGDVLKLSFDRIVCDADAAPYLRYFNHKMKREALFPIVDELEGAIGEQQRCVLVRWHHGSPVLFPQPKANPDCRKPPPSQRP